MEEWLATLHTQNIVGGVSFTDDFIPIVGEQAFTLTSHQSGSTRTRIVLAFHAVILEVALELGGNHPGWLLLDAPRQHELHQADLNAYFDRLRDVARKFQGRVQVVFSIADLSAPASADERSWAPAFGTPENPRYLGPVTSPKAGEGSTGELAVFRGREEW